MTDIVELLKMAARNGNALSSEAADEIERLRGVEQDAADWVDERTRRLRADNARLRAALQRLVAWENAVDVTCPELGGLLKAMYDARAALEGKD